MASVVTGTAFAQGANKVRSAGSTLEVVGPTTGGVTVLSTSVKNSTNADLILQVTAECGTAFLDTDVLQTDTDTNTNFTGSNVPTQQCNSFRSSFGGFQCNGFTTVIVPTPGPVITTEIAGTSADEDFIMAQVQMWVEIDGKPVPVASGDDGRVLFCKTERSTSQIQDALNVNTSLKTVESQFMASKTANSFNWHAPNVGSGTHAVEVKARVQQASTGQFSRNADSITHFQTGTTGGSETTPNTPTVSGVIGKRTLIVEPVLPQR
jgi:hypothetical protein